MRKASFWIVGALAFALGPWHGVHAAEADIFANTGTSAAPKYVPNSVSAPVYTAPASGSGSQDVNIKSVGGNAVTTTVPTNDAAAIAAIQAAAITPLNLAPTVTSTGTNAVAKAAPGNLIWATVTAGASAGYLMAINAISLPSNGAITAGILTGNLEGCIYVPANGVGTMSFGLLNTKSFSVGITLAWSSTGCGTLTAATPAYLEAAAP